MHKYDKNERLDAIIKELSNQGVIRKKHKNKLAKGEYNRRTFAEKLGTHTGVIPAIIKNERNVSDLLIHNLCKYFGVSELYMRLGCGSMFKSSFDEVSVSTNRANILYSGVSAIAGDTVGEGESAPSEAFGIPGLDGNMVAFDVSGNSMEPILKSGDMVFSRKVDSATEIRDEDIYAVVADGTVRIKYIRQLKSKNGQIVALQLLSENALEHTPIFMEVNDNIRLYKILYCLTELKERSDWFKNK